MYTGDSMNKHLVHEGKRIKAMLDQRYGRFIAVRNGDSDAYSFEVGENSKVFDLVVYLHFKKRVAVVWNNYYRREKGGYAHCFSFDGEGQDCSIENGFINTKSKSFRTEHGLEHENVLIMSFDTLEENLDYLYDLHTLTESVNGAIEENDNQVIRQKRSVLQWNRDREFRNKVLDAFGRECAICRCTEEKLLQAAHIKAVADGGNDDVNNGICLCANHHIMLDKQLIQIDHTTMRLSYIADSVKTMPWYDTFDKKYNLRIKGRTDHV